MGDDRAAPEVGVGEQPPSAGPGPCGRREKPPCKKFYLQTALCYSPEIMAGVYTVTSGSVPHGNLHTRPFVGGSARHTSRQTLVPGVPVACAPNICPPQGVLTPMTSQQPLSELEGVGIYSLCLEEE